MVKGVAPLDDINDVVELLLEVLIQSLEVFTQV